ncbi:MAG: hypothetical protein OYH77_04205 [Pseudomonadota bacterium]|nr:hypothetical protein [Pseudomonadota bacterium]
MEIHHLQLQPIVAKTLQEERRHGEWATEICVPNDLNATAEIVSKEAMVLAAVETIWEVFKSTDISLEVSTFHKNGARLPAGEVIARISGAARTIIKGERVALALLSHCCGIASTVAACVARLDGCQLLADRSVGASDTLLLEQAAASIGGVCSHRLGLGDSVLVSAKHAQLAGGSKQAVALLRESLSPTQKIAVEVNQLEQLQAASDAGADLVVLHDLELAGVSFAVRTLRNQTLTAATGEIAASMVADYAATGVNFISSETIIRNAKRAKLALNIML